MPRLRVQCPCRPRGADRGIPEGETADGPPVPICSLHGPAGRPDIRISGHVCESSNPRFLVTARRQHSDLGSCGRFH